MPTNRRGTNRRVALDIITIQVPGQIELPGLEEPPPVDLSEPELVRWYEERDELSSFTEG